MTYADVALFRKAGGFGSELTYEIPSAMGQGAGPGFLVRAPFRGTSFYGVVVRMLPSFPAGLRADQVRPVLEVSATPLLTAQAVALARFIADYYRTDIAKSVRLFVPKKIWEGKKGIVEKISEPRFRLFEYQNFGAPVFKNILTSDQSGAIGRMLASRIPTLLHGVTGSGKTEIYLRLILKVIREGKQAILLVPEIALTPQMIGYFKEFLGDRIAVFHSKLGDRERFDEWMKAKAGFAPLIIGSRSALFTPMCNVGLIIIDEEHEWTYKQESSPYYDSRRVAEEMVKIWGARLVLGSATPSAESYQKAQSGAYQLVSLPKRIRKTDMPVIHVVDLRGEFQKKNFSIFSDLLRLKMKDRLEKKEQIILFVNQRGMANAVVCRECGHTEKCPRCEIALKYHRSPVAPFESADGHPRFQGKQSGDRLLCHYCGFTQPPELLCPECKSPHIRHIGVGTQRVEEDVLKFFPQARVIRADRDTTGEKSGFEPIFRAFAEKKYDILIGTQMVAKGLDFEGVTLIGIVLADIGLHVPDFRSAERLFQILTQVSGRCGRGAGVGEVVLQTYSPDHPVIRGAAAYEYEKFMRSELDLRKNCAYPPFSRMVKFTITGKDQAELKKSIGLEKESLEDIIKTSHLDFRVACAPALVPRISGRYYYHVLIRAEDPQSLFARWDPPKGWRVDVDPMHTA